VYLDTFIIATFCPVNEAIPQVTGGCRPGAGWRRYGARWAGHISRLMAFCVAAVEILANRQRRVFLEPAIEYGTPEPA
jgi:hypothetical protein